MTALLDTHVLLHWFNRTGQLTPAQSHILTIATGESPLLVSDISIWEVAMLFSLGRIRLDRPLRDWLERATAPPLVRRVGISPAIAAEVALLPDSFHGDLADRILVATARVLGATLLTNDGRIREAGLVSTV
jgi:PIN domain nuclease of toxin-antitoxin system